MIQCWSAGAPPSKVPVPAGWDVRAPMEERLNGFVIAAWISNAAMLDNLLMLIRGTLYLRSRSCLKI